MERPSSTLKLESLANRRNSKVVNTKFQLQLLFFCGSGKWRGSPYISLILTAHAFKAGGKAALRRLRDDNRRHKK
jgi:hypothetical protein